MSSWRCSGGRPGRPTSRSGGRAPRPSLKECGRFPACTCRSCSKSLSAALRSQFLPGWEGSSTSHPHPAQKLRHFLLNICVGNYSRPQLLHLVPSLFPRSSPSATPPGHFPHYSQFSIPSRRSLASPGSAPVERTKSDRTMSIAKARQSQWHRISSSASIWE